MNESLKNRVIGAILIFLVAIIIAPLLFSGAGEKELKYKKFDDQDSIEFKYIDEVKNLEGKDKVEIKSISNFENKKIINDIDKLKISDSENMKKNSWIIRTGSFSKKINARKQMQKLEELGFTSFILKVNKDKKILLSVNIGPYFSPVTLKKEYLKLIKDSNFGSSYIVESNFEK